jgi:hypothetical protein
LTSILLSEEIMNMRPTLALILLLAPACRSPFSRDYNCTADVRPAIEVEIRDAATGSPLAQAASGVVRDGAFTDSLSPARSLSSDPSSLLSLSAAGERPGTYSVEVQRSGYRTWTATNVSVGRNACHVETRLLRADLVRIAP